MEVVFPIFHDDVRGILSATTGFIKEAGFTHSLTPARNCTFGCTYCYVPTMRVYGGLKPEDWKRWGQFTTFKSNAAELLRGALRDHQIIYCSPLVDPYQPAECAQPHMPRILEMVAQRPPRVFVIQTRGPLILRDLALLRILAKRTILRVSFSVTTDSEAIRKLYEPHCASIDERFAAIATLREAGIETFATLAPLLPCDPERLLTRAIEATKCDVIGDPLHVRATKAHGATTRQAADRISDRHGFTAWHDPAYQSQVVERMTALASDKGRRFGTGPRAFGWLAADQS
jgi:DNA repair photolyase